MYSPQSQWNGLTMMTWVTSSCGWSGFTCSHGYWILWVPMEIQATVCMSHIMLKPLLNVLMGLGLVWHNRLSYCLIVIIQLWLWFSNTHLFLSLDWYIINLPYTFAELSTQNWRGWDGNPPWNLSTWLRHNGILSQDLFQCERYPLCDQCLSLEMRYTPNLEGN